MNPLVHISMGLHAANLGLHQRYGARVSLILATASLFPDIDSVALLFSREAYAQYHRGFTHAVSGWVALGAIMALATAWGHLKRWFFIDWGLWALGMAGHTAADLITRWPIPLLYPFSERRWSFPLVSWGDGILTAAWVMLAMAALLFSHHRRSISAVAWGLGVLYLSYRAIFPSPGPSWLSRIWFGFWLR